MWEIREGDAIAVMKGMAGGSVQTCVTSPPYFNLRDYGIAGQIGLEGTPEAYIAALVEVFREVRRILRDDGSLWLNLGDSYASGPGGGVGATSIFRGPHAGGGASPSKVANGNGKRAPIPANLKPKDLLMMPHRVAIALQDDGWWVRADIVWHKPNPMPESVRDRPTRAHEYIFLLSKRKDYYYDADAIKEPPAASSMKRIGQANFANQTGGPKDYRNGINPNRSMRQTLENFAANPGRNKRDVWTVTTKPCREAHFATFPPDLITPCILSGTSEKGACPDCGAPWRRAMERTGYDGAGRADESVYTGKAYTSPQSAPRGPKRNFGEPSSVTTGWEPSCTCGRTDTVPCVAFDPFAGAGTTGMVAVAHGRAFTGIELNPEYCAIARRRIQEAASQPRLAGVA